MAAGCQELAQPSKDGMERGTAPRGWERRDCSGREQGCHAGMLSGQQVTPSCHPCPAQGAGSPAGTLVPNAGGGQGCGLPGAMRCLTAEGCN